MKSVERMGTMTISLPPSVSVTGINDIDASARNFILSSLLIGTDHTVRTVSKTNFHYSINNYFDLLRREQVIEDYRRQGQYRLINRFRPAEHKPLPLNCFGIYLNQFELDFCLDCYAVCCEMEPCCFGLVDIHVLYCFDIDEASHFRLDPLFFNLYHWRIRDAQTKKRALELNDHQSIMTALIRRFARAQQNIEIYRYQREVAHQVINSGPRLFDIWAPGDYRETINKPVIDVYSRIINFIDEKVATLDNPPPEKTAPIIKPKKTLSSIRLQEAIAVPMPEVKRVKLSQAEKMRYFLNLIESATGAMIVYRNRRIREIEEEILSDRDEEGPKSGTSEWDIADQLEAEVEIIKLFRKIARSANFNRLSADIGQNELIARIIYREKRHLVQDIRNLGERQAVLEMSGSRRNQARAERIDDIIIDLEEKIAVIDEFSNLYFHLQ